MDEEAQDSGLRLSPDETGVALAVYSANDPGAFDFTQTLSVHLTSTMPGFLNSFEFKGEGDSPLFAHITRWKSPDAAFLGEGVLYDREQFGDFVKGIRKLESSELYSGNEELDAFFAKAVDGNLVEIVVYEAKEADPVQGARYFAVRDTLQAAVAYVTGAFLTHIEDDARMADVIVWRSREGRDKALGDLRNEPDYAPWLDARENAPIQGLFSIQSGN